MSFDTTNYPCHWDETFVCTNELMCDDCEHQPAPENKKNGMADPVPVIWEPDIFGRGMGFPLCPVCGDYPYSTDRCFFCGQPFAQDEKLSEYAKPPEEIRMDCPRCKGKGTLVGIRTKSNGHFHGECSVCGCIIME